jgi:hypothetical protein
MSKPTWEAVHDQMQSAFASVKRCFLRCTRQPRSRATISLPDLIRCHTARRGPEKGVKRCKEPRPCLLLCNWPQSQLKSITWLTLTSLRTFVAQGLSRAYWADILSDFEYLVTKFIANFYDYLLEASFLSRLELHDTLWASQRCSTQQVPATSDHSTPWRLLALEFLWSLAGWEKPLSVSSQYLSLGFGELRVDITEGFKLHAGHRWKDPAIVTCLRIFLILSKPVVSA